MRWIIGAVLAVPKVTAHSSELVHLYEQPLVIVKIIVVTISLVFIVRRIAQGNNQ